MPKQLPASPSPFAGHFWTLVQPWHLRGTANEQCHWTCTVDDPQMGPVQLSGALGGHVQGENLVMLVHGMGGHANSAYMRHAATSIEEQGLAWLRLNLRGADRSGEDMYHSGLTADLHAALGSPALQRYRKIWIVGFSLGGHVTLRFATQVNDPRVKGAVAVSAPLDLGCVAQHLDRASLWLYRTYLLHAVTQIYAAVANRRACPVPVADVRRARSVRRWDSLVLVPRFGFRDVDDYYESMSVGPRLNQLRVRTLLVHSALDPMVPLASLTPYLQAASPLLDVRITAAGGHVNFPPRIDIGQPLARGLVPQVLNWCVSPGAQ